MRPNLSWSDLAAAGRVGIYGLGREGTASLRACRARGIEPVLVDDAPAAELVDAVDDVLATGDGGAAALSECDVVIAGPGVPYHGSVLASLRDHGVQVVGGLGLWLAEADPEKVVCITGTKGKSTTTAVAGHLAGGLGVRARTGGNIGVPPYDPQVAGDGPVDLWVIEVSSYQAVYVPRSPAVVGVTSLHPDHLPWHGGDPEQYYRDKLSICTQPGARLTVANGDSELLRQHEELLGPAVLWVHEDAPDSGWAAELGLLGVHNRRNAVIAARLLAEAGVPGADDPAALAAAAKGFHALDSRLQLVAEVGGVSFVDDGLSTNVLPTLAAVEAFPDRRVALIVGGQDRGIDYAPFALGLRTRAHELMVITVPDNGPRIAATLDEIWPGPAVILETAESLDTAVGLGYAWARPDGVVLLSPAAPSFGRFVDYRHRGAAFTAAAKALTPPLG